MKIHIVSLLFISLFTISIFSSAQNKVINRPDAESSNTESIYIDRLELSGNATILHCDAYNSPGYWVKIASDSYLKGKSGKMYKLLRSEGFELDKEVSMPESGTIPFRLYFEPLDKNEETFDFIEGDSEGAFHISGIKTSKTETNTAIKCIIKGEVIDRPQSSLLYLTRKGGDARVKKTVIPIRDGKFEYEINSDEIEAYELAFSDELRRGSWRPVYFFSENGVIEMKLHPMEESGKNIVKGGPLNAEYLEYNDKLKKVSDSFFSRPNYSENLNNLDNNAYTRELRTVLPDAKNNDADKSGDIRTKMSVLWEEDRYMNETAKELLKTAKELENEDEKHKIMRQFYDLQESMKHMSPEAEALEKQISAIEALIGDWEIQYMRDNVSLVSYSRLVQAIKLSLSTFPVYHSTYGKTGEYIGLYSSIYSKKYPAHPYTKEMATIIDSYLSIKPGGKYIDFTAPDFEGKPVTLSQQISGKVALIDLWASWCGPCRRLSMSMIPVYEEYKDKGFTIVGVAREENAQHATIAVQKDKYPWLNLLELNDKNEIWKKYGIGNAGGSTFLVDRDGTILAVHPTAEEVRRILNEKLSQ